MRARFYLLFFVAAITARAQEYPQQPIDLQQIADDLYGFQDLDIAYEELYENVILLLSHRINLNSATAEQLRFIPVLSEQAIQRILTYRSTHGKFLSVYELQAVPDLDLSTIYKLMPFVQVIDPDAVVGLSMLERIQNESDNFFLMRYGRGLQTKQGFREATNPASRFQGSPDKVYMRFRSSRPGDFSVGFTADKDEGEPMTWNPSKKYYGFDFFSAHAQVMNKGRLKNLVVGDFQNQFGQGMMLGGIFGMGKGGETVTTVRRSNIGLLPYTSAYEAGYLRGVGATVALDRNLYATAFYSRTRRDASVSLANDETESSIISSFQTTGLHRNENERSRRKAVGETNSGFVLQYKKGLLDMGVMVNQVSFDTPVKRNVTPYNQFTFQGRHNTNVGYYLNYSVDQLAFFSEVSRSLNGGYGLVAGSLVSLTPKFDMAMVFRKFDRNFYTFYSNAFAESTVPQNETGLYWGWKHRFNRTYSISGYADLFQFPWLRYRSYTPSSGYEWLVRFTYQPSRRVMVFVQAREEMKVRNISPTTSSLYLTDAGKKNNYWISCQYGLGEKLTLRSRVQFSTYTIDDRVTTGMVLLQDISVAVNRYKFTGRVALFDTDDYDNRQYVYENDVWLAYSLPAFHGVGLRQYAMLEYKASKLLTIWCRYGYTRFHNLEKIGSGVETINGNVRNDIKLQVRIRF